MLRSSIAPSRQLLSLPVRQRTATQWLSRAGASNRLAGQRFFADIKPPAPPAPAAPTPASPASETVVPPETVPKPKPETAEKGSVPPPPAPPSAPVRKTGRFRRFLLYLILTSGIAYGGGVFLALKFDNFHDFFTEYVPYGEESVLYFEERDFYRRFPNALSHPNRLPPAAKDGGNKVTIPSKSGLSWKVANDEPVGTDLSQKGPHMSAIKKAELEDAKSKEEKTATVAKAKEQAKKESAPEKKEPAPKEQPKEEPRKPVLSPITTIELLKIQDGDEPLVQELVKTFNDIITVISADESANRFSGPVSKAKEELQAIGEKINKIGEEARSAAQEEIKKAHSTFDESARELIRRFEETRTDDVARFREEFEAEREKLALSYQEKIKTELLRAQEIAEQRLQNELVEQAIELNRKYLHDVQDLVEREREGRLSKLGELTANVSELEKLTTDWKEVIDANLKTQQLQVAVDAVRSVLERAETARPFVRELVAVKELAADDPVVDAAIASINPTAYQRGIPSTPQVIDRFRRVASEVRKASLLPEDAGIASHAASFVLSKVMFKKDGLADGDDVESVLLRTESLLEEGNLDAAAREMNALQGWAKILSKDWLADVRRVLEVKQALENRLFPVITGLFFLCYFAQAPVISRKCTSSCTSLALRPMLDLLCPNAAVASSVDVKQPVGSQAQVSRAFAAEEPLMTDGRASGELEGSTLGTSSRDGDRGGDSQRHRRMLSSGGGFLLDSSFLLRSGSKFARSGSIRNPRRLDTQTVERRPAVVVEKHPVEKRVAAPDGDLVMPKKRSHFPWGSRQKRAVDSPTLQDPASAATDSQNGLLLPAPRMEEEPAGDNPLQEAGLRGDNEPPPAAVGLDNDSLQIVNLALNLSESRKRTASSRPTIGQVSGGRRVASAGQSSTSYSDVHGVSGLGSTTGPAIFQARHGSVNKLPEWASPGPEFRTSYTPKDGYPLREFLPSYATEEAGSLPYAVSSSTLARVEKTRQYFELLSEYLRLLDCLPPLRDPMVEGASETSPRVDEDLKHNRVYNPLQAIRNRKIRFREKCPIDPNADGWNDAAKIHDWIGAIEQRYGKQAHPTTECLNLPTFQARPGQPAKQNDFEEFDMSTVSPSASLRRASHTSSVKVSRPRFDWIISPAELLCDAAWLEEGINKTKIVNKDGIKLYPDTSELVRYGDQADPDNAGQEDISENKDTTVPEPRESISSARKYLSRESTQTSRGRRKHRFNSPSSEEQSRSDRKKTRRPKWQRPIIRSHSTSSASSVEDSNIDKHSRTKKPEKRLPMLNTFTHTRAALSTSSHFSPLQSGRNYGWMRTYPQKRASISSATSMEDRNIRRMSLEEKDSTAPNSPVQAGLFPSIAVNLDSPPSSRSPSPSKMPFPRVVGPLHERNKSKHRIKDLRERAGETGASESDALRRKETLGPSDLAERPGQLEPSPLPDRVATSYPDDHAFEGVSRQESLKNHNKAGHPESKLRGIFKNRGRIAEIVGYEVSKVGDRILKKDGFPTSRRSSSASSSLESDECDSDGGEETKNGGKSGPRALLRRLPTFTDDNIRVSRAGAEKGPSKNFIPHLPIFTPQRPLNEESGEEREPSYLGDQQVRDVSSTSRPLGSSGLIGVQGNTHEARDAVGSPLQHKGHGRIQNIPHPQPFSLNNPPVTGLAKLEASVGAAASVKKRPRLAENTRSWSISNRSITTLADYGLPSRREVGRTRALLLSSGIKAREITRRAESCSARNKLLTKSILDISNANPKVSRMQVFELAAEEMLHQFETSRSTLEQSMDRFSSAVASPLREQLHSLEDLVNQSLTPRVRAAASDAESLSLHLNTTSTLAVKQLSDVLEQGVRKRNRRFRSVRHAGFVMLEWTLVAVLWWVWLLVMVFRVLRAILRGVISSIRWVLWL
ncbi:hypothetical protein ASPZODRAFT_120940 [Penicilliopsis zonata CBS 506.65]|uniref:MICOS complex subunit MIC60 n=1 Tax=Penicilliopsis zonata CBS 506.65 TaxID=1073090 RepID=A0A1L9SC08_9EURO|nr:hypothetical protein ASPZODRAFT_120940 [Penicilliopsis zonata CBS 506.65]OJJ44627.1 hypothetical protein ASPZODRAFT_120940 [Penicilliopsis zonata CBS 506.65]